MGQSSIPPLTPGGPRRRVVENQSEQADGGALAAIMPETLFRPILDREFAAGKYRLPLMPAAAERAIKIARQPNSSFADCERAVQEDAALVIEVLRVANSPQYRRREMCASLTDAAARLGFGGLRDLLLAASVGRLLIVRNDPTLTRELHERSLAVALAARGIARILKTDEDSAYLAGLIHDVGWSVVFGLVQVARKELPAEVVDDPMRLRKIAQSLHAGFGARMAQLWKLPDALVWAIAGHHSPDRVSVGAALAYQVAAAVRICDTLGICPEREWGPLHEDPVVRRLGLKRPAIEELMTSFRIDWGIK